MSRVTVSADKLNSLLSALEGVGRYAELVSGVQSSVRKIVEKPAKVEDVAQPFFDFGSENIVPQEDATPFEVAISKKSKN